ncbi:hemicentin-2-like [Artemia franciscana]|uniref:hemicentin-2-like n=1 Tax=Artemia franciscana TaxID=6661 RepID=UPI0032DB7A5B
MIQSVFRKLSLEESFYICLITMMCSADVTDSKSYHKLNQNHESEFKYDGYSDLIKTNIHKNYIGEDYPDDEHVEGQERFPFFDEYGSGSNITVQLGETAFLNCRIHDLQDKTVSWVRRQDSDVHLLTFGRQTYSTDSRFSLNFQQPNDWRLQIRYASPRDEGIYECQISTHPPNVYTMRLRVVVPKVEMVDDHGQVIEEKNYETGSTIELKCVISQVPSPAANVMWRHGIRLLNYDTSRGGISVKTDLLPQGAVSRLYIANASQRDAGNYTCAISEQSQTTVVVHILNGEHPAAMQHNSSCQKAYAFILIAVLLLYHLERNY